MPKTIGDFITRKFGSATALGIFGLGREGNSTYEFIRRYLPEIKITLIDDQPLAGLSPIWAERVAADDHLEFMTSHQALKTKLAANVIFLTPGIPLHHPFRLKWIADDHLFTSNMQVFFELINAVYSDLKIIGVTGTKGKSTTTALIHHVLSQTEIPTWLGGNIGVAALDLVPFLRSDVPGYVVLEMSAHQLDLMSVSPQIAVIQKIVPEHLDYYGDFDRYIAAKAHITIFQTTHDFAIFNPTIVSSTQVARQGSGKKLGFVSGNHSAQSTKCEVLAEIKDNEVYLTSRSSNRKQLVLKLSEISLKGAHNRENILPAIVVASLLKIEVSALAAALKSFKGLPHRMELVATVNGVEYYNDSLATVEDATIAALNTFTQQPVVLIAGGYDRGVGVNHLAKKILNHNIRALILFPTTGDQLMAEIERLRLANHQTLPTFSTYSVTTMPAAIKLAAQVTEPGDVVLMSPAAASFNLFRDYQDRGNQFKAAVMALAH